MSTDTYVQVVIDLSIYAHSAELSPKSQVAKGKISD